MYSQNEEKSIQLMQFGKNQSSFATCIRNPQEESSNYWIKISSTRPVRKCRACCIAWVLTHDMKERGR